MAHGQGFALNLVCWVGSISPQEVTGSSRDLIWADIR
jgi:hypothetical protein